MQALLDFFAPVGEFLMSILDFFVSLFQFLMMIINGVLWLVGSLPDLIAQVTALFAYCPPFIGIFLTASLCIIVLYAIIKAI